MLPKAHLTSHSSMSGSRWVITPSWLSGSWISFLYTSSVYSGHLFLISSASLRSLPFLSFISMSKISFQYVISVKTINGIIYLLFHITSLKFGTSQFELATSQVLSCHMWLPYWAVLFWMVTVAGLHVYPGELINVWLRTMDKRHFKTFLFGNNFKHTYKLQES